MVRIISEVASANELPLYSAVLSTGVEVDFPPRIVFDPTFAPTFHDFQKKVPVPSKINVTQRSTLIVRGVDITIESLDLDGTLVIEASPGM